METVIAFSDVKYLNLHYLLTVQANLRRDFITTCYRFHLPADAGVKLQDMSVDAIHLLAANVPGESLFKPLDNFCDLLDAPLGLALVMSTVGMRTSVTSPALGGQHDNATCRSAH